MAGWWGRWEESEVCKVGKRFMPSGIINAFITSASFFCLLVYSCFTDEESHLEEAESLPTWYSKVLAEGQSGQVPLGCRVWAPTLAPPTADTSRHKRPPLHAGSSLVGKAFSHRAQIGLPVLFTLRVCFWPQQHHEACQPLPLHSGTLGHGSQPCWAPQVLLLGHWRISVWALL